MPIVLVYFSGPWKNILALWQYYKILLFQITNKANLTWPYLTNLTFPNPVGGNQRPTSEALKLLVLRCDVRSYL